MKKSWRVATLIAGVFTLVSAAIAAATGEDADSAKPLEVVVYPAVGTAGASMVVEGRIIRQEARSEVDASDGRRRNLKRNLKLLMNREVADVPVVVSIGSVAVSGVSDKEGYFRVSFPPAGLPGAGWHVVSVDAQGHKGAGSVLLVAAAAAEGIISDVDDTLQVTGVTSKRSMLGNSLLRNPAQRQPVERTPELLRHLVDGPTARACCVIYLSASPRQLHSSIQSFLDLNRFPRGVLITKRVTNDSTSDSLRDQRRYKLTRLEEVFARLPQMRFTLLGDDGEVDPEIYAEMARRHPGRVSGIWIRETPGAGKRERLAGQGSFAELIAATVDCKAQSSAAAGAAAVVAVPPAGCAAP